ncbi:uncharacterized protein [Littorina saxatilis]
MTQPRISWRLCAMRRRLKLFCVLTFVVSVATVLYFTAQTSRIHNFSQLRFRAGIGRLMGFGDVIGPLNDVKKCDSVFPGMLLGRWAPKENVSEARRKTMDEYLVNTRGEYNIPRSLQRSDGRCGSVPFDGVPLFRHMWFRSLCNPNGPTPCCYLDHCTNRTREDCACSTCLDTRSPLHAELSDWLPERAECKPREISSREACELLNGTTLVLAGDSFVRHVFVALVMLLTDDFQDGALKQNAPANIQQICQGMYQINGLRCRGILDQNRTLCGGTVTATYLEIMSAGAGRFLLPHIDNLHTRKQRVLLLAGLGIHNDFRIDLVWPLFIQPLVEYFTNSTSSSLVNMNVSDSEGARMASWFDLRKKYGVGNAVPPLILGSNKLPSSNKPPSSFSVQPGNKATPSSLRPWPKFIWAGTHAPGLLKTPVLPAQSYQGVKFYNEAMARRLEPLGIPVLDSFNMTAPLHAVDGTHYGYGANHLKVQVLLHWVKERQDRGEW